MHGGGGDRSGEILRDSWLDRPHGVMQRSGPAVFVFGREGDVMAFPHVEDASGWMEAIDVNAGEYEGAFTLDGRIVAIGTAPKDAIVLRITDERDPSELRARLGRSLANMGLEGDLDDLTSVANEL